MPLPLIPVLVAGGTAVVGIYKSAKAFIDKRQADKTNKQAKNVLDSAKNRLDLAKGRSGNALKSLGKEKATILNDSVLHFVKAFEQIKNVDFHTSDSLLEINKLKIDKQQLKELKEMGNLAASLLGGVAGGAVGGALTAFGAYAIAGKVALASTGTAIAHLSGVAATNATLAFFGGGSLAAGGLGVAGGTIVLSGLVAGPALAVMGFIVGAQASKEKDEAYANLAKARRYAKEMDCATDLCNGITERAEMFIQLLKQIDGYFKPAIKAMEDAISEHGADYALFSGDQKRATAAAASLALAVKTVIDTPILTKDGNLTSESEELLKDYSRKTF